MTIRAATLGDEQCLAELNGFVHGIHTRSRPEHFKTSSLAEVAAWFRSLLETSAARIWIAEVDGTAVGYVLSEVHASPESSLCRARRWCEIDQIAVDSQHRRRGIASALVREAIRAAACEGIADVELCTWAFNEEAQATFRELGFAPKVIRWELRRPHDDVVQVVPPQ